MRVGTSENFDFDDFCGQNRAFCNLRPRHWMRSQNSHLTCARRELRQDACTKRSTDHASMQSMQMVRRVRHNALGKSALGIQAAAIQRIVCRARDVARIDWRAKPIRERSSVESRSSVCYFLRARGVAQLGSAPALGAGGRPFKSARPDRASSSGGKSNGLLSRGSGVRIPSGAPRRRILNRRHDAPGGLKQTEGGECSSVGRASDCGSGGRGFKSLHSPQISCYVSVVSTVGR